ncbi:MAG: ATP-binding cassette domain-containing protein [Thermofilaceae archaeon]
MTLGNKSVVNNASTVFSNKHIVLGPNGSGKTTLFKAIAGLVPFRGEIIIDGVLLARLQNGLGLLATNLAEVYSLVPVRAWEVALLFSDIMDVDLKLAKRLLLELGVPMVDIESRKLWELSAGTLKAFCTVLALASGAKNVLLDEPFEQLDPAKKARLAKILDSYRGTLVLNTHETWILNTLRDWQAHIMVDGRIFGPAPAGKLASARIVKGKVESPLLRVSLEETELSFVEEGAGEPVSSLLTLDRLYDIVVRSG